MTGNMIQFSDVMIGEEFYFAGNKYVKTSCNLSNYELFANCKSLTDGIAYSISDCQIVRKSV